MILIFSPVAEGAAPIYNAEWLKDQLPAKTITAGRRPPEASLYWISEKCMAGVVKGIPEDSSVVIPRLVCRDVAAAIEFCTKTFGAADLGGRPGPDGKVAHALIRIGPAMIMIEAEWPTLTSRAPALDGTSPVVIFVYVEDVDETVKRAVAGGAKVLVPVQNQFWGDRTGWIMDPSGHVWTIATRVEETSEDQRRERWSKTLSDNKSNHLDRENG